MHPRAKAAFLAALALRGSAVAQQPEGSMNAAPGEPGQPPAEAAPPATPGEVSPDGVYTIKGGDTLWDLSQRFLNNPWYWPKIWADNPAVENPHWIYPGNNLKIRVGGEGMPGEVSPALGATDEEPWGDEGTPIAKPAKPELADFTVGNLQTADSLGQDGDLVSMAGRKGIGALPNGVLKARIQSIVTTGELMQSGTIEGSFEQKGMLATGDRVYVAFKELDKVRIGDGYSVFRTGDEIVHPITHQSFGVQTVLLGSMKIVAKEGSRAVAEIGATYDVIERGDRVGPAAALDKTVRNLPNSKALEGVILATEVPRLVGIAEQHVVFIDRGSEQGVQEGNTFTVVQHGDGLEQLQLNPEATGYLDHTEGPSEPVASLMVFDVRPNTSAAMVTKSLREVMVGDKVVMRPAGAGGDAGR